LYRFLLFHTHSLVWGIKERKLAEHWQGMDWKMRPLFPYASAVRWTSINPAHLFQMAWYVTEAPRSQYQVWKRDTGSKQAKRELNGMNSVRVYKAMKDVTLDQLTLAGGEGVRLRDRSLRDARSASSPLEISRRPKMKTWSTAHPIWDW
jgi:hypothetical protein